MTLVDLHVHTNHSDGYDAPSEVVKQAKDNGVGIIAVTDHDNLGGIGEALAAGRKLGVAVVVGAEISASFHGRTVHMLGLGLPTDDGKFNEFLAEIYVRRKETIIAKMEKIGAASVAAGKKHIDMADFIAKQGRYFNREKAGQYLVANGFADKQDAAFRLMTETEIGVGFMVSAGEVIAAIHAAKGVAILAHPFARGTSLCSLNPTREGQEKLLKELIDAGLDGFECYQSEYGPEKTALALELAGKYGQLVSAGSDWHGAVCDKGWDIKSVKAYYPEHIGGLGVTADKVAPLLARLGVAVDKS
jgi:3',5'-nucleoside bisphosphate phosphatase